jgi:hypothetical protein
MDLYLREHITTKFLKDIAAEMGLKVTQVYSRAEWLGLAKNRMTVKRMNLRGVSRWTSEEAAYIAGIVDGEGTISFGKRVRKGRLYIRPLVYVSNTSLPLMQFQQKIGMYPVIARNTSGKLYWRCEVSGFQCLDLLERIYPYLVVKKRHCEILTEVIRIRQAQGLHDSPTPRIITLLEELRGLNRRGSRFQDELERAGLSLTSLRPSTASSPTAS